MTPIKIPVSFGVAVTSGELLGLQVGGLPFGIDQNSWPTSPEGEPLHFIAQIPLKGVSDRFAMAYVFMAQTYDPETCECINETFDPETGLTSVLLVRSPAESRALGPSVGEPEYYDLEDSWHFYFDSTDEMPDEWIALLDQEPDEGPVRVGGPVRWWQGGDNHPVDREGRPMRLAAEIRSAAHAGLDNYIAAGVCHVFFSEETGEGAIVWEVD